MLGKLVAMIGRRWRSFWGVGKPENDLEKHVSSLEEGIKGLKLQLAKAIQQEKCLSTRLSEFELLVEECGSTAVACLEQGREEPARDALRKKRAHRQNAEAVGAELAEQRKTVKLLEERHRILETQLEEAKTQFDLLRCRQKRTEVKLQASEILESAHQGIDRCNDSYAIPVSAVKREILANAALNTESANLSETLGLLSCEQSIDEELASLKNRLKGKPNNE